MQDSNLGLQTWMIATYLLSTNIKGHASMKLHRDLGITYKTAWHLAHRIRETWEKDQSLFSGPVEVDETYIGGKRRNMHLAKRRQLTGRGPVGKTAVVGMKDRDSNHVAAEVVHATDSKTLQSFVSDHAAPGAQVYTDDAQAYNGIPFPHESVKHSVGEYVRDMAHTNGMESFWAMLKRGYTGIYHRMSPKHLPRYVAEFEGRHNQRSRDTRDQLIENATGMIGKRLRYQDLVRGK